MVEHLTFNQTVVGSNLATLNYMTTKSYWNITSWPVVTEAYSKRVIQIYLSILQFLVKLNPHFSNITTPLWNSFFKSKVRNIGWSPLEDRSGLGYNSRKSMIRRKSKKLTPNFNLAIKYNQHESLWSLFLQNWSTFRPKSNQIYSTNRDFRLFFLIGSPERSYTNVINTRRYFLRWVDSYNFLFNLFYVESESQLLSNKAFIEESLTFNWYLSYKNFKLFRLTQPFFVFKDAQHGEKIHNAVLTILSQKLDFTILVDIKNHEKLLQYLKRYNMYIISLVPINYSPWKVSYPIPTFSDSVISQYYFIRWLFYIKSSSDALRFSTTIKRWKMFF